MQKLKDISNIPRAPYQGFQAFSSFADTFDKKGQAFAEENYVDTQLVIFIKANIKP